MKRIVVCPSCKIKMQIFDIGKEINQKCPRCKNSFDIQPVQAKDKDKAADKGAMEQPKNEAAKPTEPETPKSETAKAAEAEAPKSEPLTIKEEPKSVDQPIEKKIMVKPPTQGAAKNESSTSAKEITADKPAAAASPADGKPDVEVKAAEADKPADKAKTAEADAPAKENGSSAGSLKKPIAATKPAITATPAPAPLPTTVVAGFSGLQFKVLFVMVLVMIIIQIVLAKRQMTQLSIVNENLITIHKKL